MQQQQLGRHCIVLGLWRVSRAPTAGSRGIFLGDGMLDKGLACVTRHSVANRKSAFDDEVEWTKPGYMQMQLDLDIAQMKACISVISWTYHLRETWQ